MVQIHGHKYLNLQLEDLENNVVNVGIIFQLQMLKKEIEQSKKMKQFSSFIIKQVQNGVRLLNAQKEGKVINIYRTENSIKNRFYSTLRKISSQNQSQNLGQETPNQSQQNSNDQQLIQQEEKIKNQNKQNEDQQDQQQSNSVIELNLLQDKEDPSNQKHKKKNKNSKQHLAQLLASLQDNAKVQYENRKKQKIDELLHIQTNYHQQNNYLHNNQLCQADKQDTHYKGRQEEDTQNIINQTQDQLLLKNRHIVTNFKDKASDNDVQLEQDYQPFLTSRSNLIRSHNNQIQQHQNICQDQQLTKNEPKENEPQCVISAMKQKNTFLLNQIGEIQKILSQAVQSIEHQPINQNQDINCEQKCINEMNKDQLQDISLKQYYPNVKSSFEDCDQDSMNAEVYQQKRGTQKFNSQNDQSNLDCQLQAIENYLRHQQNELKNLNTERFQQMQQGYDQNHLMDSPRSIQSNAIQHFNQVQSPQKMHCESQIIKHSNQNTNDKRANSVQQREKAIALLNRVNQIEQLFSSVRKELFALEVNLNSESKYL